MSSPISRSSKPFLKESPSVSPADELINEMIKKRKLQQEALLKIMTSIDAKEKKVASKAAKAKKRKSKNK